MTASTDVIDHIARLSLLQLNDQERDKMSKNLDDIISFIDQVNAYKTPDTLITDEPTSGQPLRADEPSPSPISRDTIQENAPSTEEGLYLVPDVIDTSSE